MGEKVAYIIYILYSAISTMSADNEINGSNDQHRSGQAFTIISYQMITLKTAERLSACLPLSFLNRNVNIETGDVLLRPFKDGMSMLCLFIYLFICQGFFSKMCLRFSE